MHLAVFGAKAYDRKFLSAALEASKSSSSPPSAASSLEISYFDYNLSPSTVTLLPKSKYDAVCVFVNDVLSSDVLSGLQSAGVRAVLLRCAGSNNVDLPAASDLGLFVANVPAYSPEAVAEFAIAVLQTLNRKTHRAFNRVREGNFNVEGLLGRTLYGKTVGIIGTGRIGISFARIMRGFGCNLLAFDPKPNPQFDEFGKYLSLEELLPQCDFISLHCPLMKQTEHIINEKSLGQLKPGAVLINTSRGGLVDTGAAIAALKNKRLGGLGLDVYEGEGALFYADHSGDIIEDDQLMRLLTFPNVLVCGHQAFFTEEALQEISECTLRNLFEFAEGKEGSNSLVNKDKPAPVRTV